MAHNLVPNDEVQRGSIRWRQILNEYRSYIDFPPWSIELFELTAESLDLFNLLELPHCYLIEFDRWRQKASEPTKSAKMCAKKVTWWIIRKGKAMLSNWRDRFLQNQLSLQVILWKWRDSMSNTPTNCLFVPIPHGPWRCRSGETGYPVINPWLTRDLTTSFPGLFPLKLNLPSQFKGKCPGNEVE